MAFRRSKLWGDSQPDYGAVVDWGDPISVGLVALWLMTENGGVRSIDLARGNHGTITGAVGWRNGHHGKAQDFDGSTAYNSIPLTTWMTGLDTQYAVSAMVKPDSVTGSRMIASYRSTSTSTSTKILFDNNGADVRFFVRDDTASNMSATKTGGAVIGKWNHVVGSRSGNTCYVSVNGAIATGSGTIGAITVNSMNIGATTAGSATRTAFFDGAIQTVRIWNRALTVTEARRLYTEPFAGIVSPRMNMRSTVAAAGGFKAAWIASRSAHLIGGGMR